VLKSGRGSDCRTSCGSDCRTSCGSDCRTSCGSDCRTSRGSDCPEADRPVELDGLDVVVRDLHGAGERRGEHRLVREDHGPAGGALGRRADVVREGLCGRRSEAVARIRPGDGRVEQRHGRLQAERPEIRLAHGEAVAPHEHAALRVRVDAERVGPQREHAAVGLPAHDARPGLRAGQLNVDVGHRGVHPLQDDPLVPEEVANALIRRRRVEEAVIEAGRDLRDRPVEAGAHVGRDERRSRRPRARDGREPHHPIGRRRVDDVGQRIPREHAGAKRVVAAAGAAVRLLVRERHVAKELDLVALPIPHHEHRLVEERALPASHDEPDLHVRGAAARRVGVTEEQHLRRRHARDEVARRDDAPRRVVHPVGLAREDRLRLRERHDGVVRERERGLHDGGHVQDAVLPEHHRRGRDRTHRGDRHHARHVIPCIEGDPPTTTDSPCQLTTGARPARS
jgi:hypothetical protein